VGSGVGSCGLREGTMGAGREAEQPMSSAGSDIRVRPDDPRTADGVQAVGIEDSDGVPSEESGIIPGTERSAVTAGAEESGISVRPESANGQRLTGGSSTEVGATQSTVTSRGNPFAMLARHGEVMQDMAQEMLVDMRQPLARGLSTVMKTFKDLTQDVVEVIRIVAVEVDLPADVPAEPFHIELTMEGPGRRLCCRRHRSEVYGTFRFPLENAGGGVLRSSFVNCDCRVLALCRRRGALRLEMNLRGEASSSRKFSQTPRRRQSAPTILARYCSTIPTHSETPEMHVRATAAEYLAHRYHLSHHHTSLDESTVRVTLRVLESDQVFDISRCQPSSHMKIMGYNEWKPTTGKQWSAVWKSPWRDEDLINWTSLLNTMTTEMKNDVIITYQTLFAQSSRHAPWRPKLSPAEEEAHDLRVLFLKRLFLCLAACKLTFCTEENGTNMRPWPFPLASALAHGNRILVRLDGVHWHDFLNLLLFGDPKAHHWTSEDVPSPFWARWAATHAIGLHPNSRLYERRLKSGSAFKNVKDGFLGHHLGMDLPIGGLGNRAPPCKHGPLFVGSAGVPFRRNAGGVDVKYMEDIQHGHLYLRWDDFGVTTVPVLAAEGSRSSTPAPLADPGVASLEGGGRTSRASTASRLSTQMSRGMTQGSVATPSVATPRDKPMTPSCYGDEEWVQVPAIRSVEDLQAVLSHHGYGEVSRSQEGSVQLHQLLVEDGELALQSNVEGCLRLRGVIIHLVLEQQIDGEHKVLVHRAADAVADPSPGEDHEQNWMAEARHGLQRAFSNVPVALQAMNLMRSERVSGQGSQSASPSGGGAARRSASHRQVEDPRMAAVVRRRHEPWKEAMRRLCQTQLRLGGEATEKILERCSRAMTGMVSTPNRVKEEEEMYIYSCDGPPSLCHHHRGFGSLPLEYQAYRFTFIVNKSDRQIFQSLCQAGFETVEHSQNLSNFGEGLQGRRGSIFRTWQWMSRHEATELQVAGLEPPEERLHIVQGSETLSAILIGIENSAPHKESLFGGKHGINGASKDVSPFGVRKWRDYRKGGQEVPADLGGMRMHIDQRSFEGLVELCNSAPLHRPSAGWVSTPQGKRERQLFRALLMASDEEAEEVLREHLQFGRPVMFHYTGTMVLDSDVRERSQFRASSCGQASSQRSLYSINRSRSEADPDDSDDDDDDDEDTGPMGVPTQSGSGHTPSGSGHTTSATLDSEAGNGGGGEPQDSFVPISVEV